MIIINNITYVCFGHFRQDNKARTSSQIEQLGRLRQNYRHLWVELHQLNLQYQRNQEVETQLARFPQNRYGSYQK